MCGDVGYIAGELYEARLEASVTCYNCGEPMEELSGVILSLIAVVGIILAAAWLLRRTPFAAATRRNGPLKLVASLPLGPKERLLLVEADGCEVLIGVSPAGIFPLHQTENGVSSERPKNGSPEAPFAESMPSMLLGERS